LVPFGQQNRTFGPYLAAIYRILNSVMAVWARPHPLAQGFSPVLARGLQLLLAFLKVRTPSGTLCSPQGLLQTGVPRAAPERAAEGNHGLVKPAERSQRQTHPVVRFCPCRAQLHCLPPPQQPNGLALDTKDKLRATTACKVVRVGV
jgi:hypothetical protein